MPETEDVIRRYTSISSAIDTLLRKELALLDPQAWDDRNDRYFMGLYKEKKGVGGLYAVCAAQCRETYHHWRVFTNTADGACIEIRRKPLEDWLSTLPSARFGPVDYLVLPKVEGLTTRDVDRLPFVKRHGFAAEDEYRILVETQDAQQPALGIPLPIAWIARVHLNPWLPKTVSDSLKVALKSLPGCSKLPVLKSQLIDSSRWKQAGDRVVGRKVVRERLHLKR